MARAVVGLGSNLDDRRADLEAAMRELPRTGLDVLPRSAVSETAPVGGPPQGDFLNAAVLVESELGPRELVARLLEIEARLGRVRRAGERDAPRTIDLDLLWIEGVASDEAGATVPHPRLRE